MRFIFVLLFAALFVFTGCATNTTKDSAGNTTSTTATTQVGDQAIAAAVQIAAQAAQAAIAKYLSAQPLHARVALSQKEPAIQASKAATAIVIAEAEPNLSSRQVIKIVDRAYAAEIRKRR